MLESSLYFLEDFPVGVCLIDKDYRVKLWNRRLEVWTGYEASDVVGQDARDVFPKLNEIRYQNRLDLLFKGGAPAIFSALLHKDIFTPKHGESSRSVFNTTAMAKPSARAFEHDILFVVEDVTAFHKRTEQLEIINGQLESFVHAASHDMRAPLRRISGFSQLIYDELSGKVSDEVEQYLGFLVKQSKQLDLLLVALLDYSRAVSGEIILSEVSLDEVLEIALSALAPYIDEHGVEIVREVLPKVQCDGALISLVFQNLISNAIKYNKSVKPVVKISCVVYDKQNSYPIFVVRDNGIGVDPEYLEAIFAPFKRLHSQHEFVGSGIGLSTCRNILKRHGGIIWAENNEDGGASFYFAFANEE